MPQTAIFSSRIPDEEYEAITGEDLNKTSAFVELCRIASKGLFDQMGYEWDDDAFYLDDDETGLYTDATRCVQALVLSGFIRLSDYGWDNDASNVVRL